jgi:hypothetical protein
MFLIYPSLRSKFGFFTVLTICAHVIANSLAKIIQVTLWFCVVFEVLMCTPDVCRKYLMLNTYHY